MTLATWCVDLQNPISKLTTQALPGRPPSKRRPPTDWHPNSFSSDAYDAAEIGKVPESQLAHIVLCGGEIVLASQTSSLNSNATQQSEIRCLAFKCGTVKVQG